jgi:glucose-6-phosphate isomerase
VEYSNNYSPKLSDQELLELIKKEQDTIGYYKLPFQDTDKIKEYASSVTQKYVAVIGIGGSSLGTYAIYDFLRKTNEYDKELLFFESTDPIDINSRIKSIDLNDTLFIVISKSGTTVETVSVFKYLSTLVDMTSENCMVITENDSKLQAYATKNNLASFEVPKDVGGRFSVFSAVGLVPLAIIGVDIDKLLGGCREFYDSFFKMGEDFGSLVNKARFIAKNNQEFGINVLFSYSALLDGFNKWYVQLWGESLGKIDLKGRHQGLTPIGITGPVDQHSFLQLIMEGKRDKTVTFIKIKDFGDNVKIPDISLSNLEGVNFVNGLKFQELINYQADATIQAVKNLKDVPCDVIEIRKIDEHSLAKLMYSYEVLTSLVGQLLKINTYDQPGVEAGKIILKEILTK